jgi:LysR family transcriptional activator of nhaA
MRHLNYKHLHYFWVIATEGGIARAAERLYLTPQTLSGQLARLEEAIGEKLFHRKGRTLVLSDAGEITFRYADEMFRLGAELTDVVKGRLPAGAGVLRVGIVDVVPKLVASRILQPAVEMKPPVKLVCTEGKLQGLLSDLSRHRVDLVIADTPAPASALKVFNHPLGESAVGFFAAGALAARCRRDFPRCLNGTPMLLPAPNTALRRAIDLWLDRNGLEPQVRAEIEDSALTKVFGASGLGVFAAPTLIESEVIAQFGVTLIGRVEAISEAFIAISAERRLRHPAVVRITEQARAALARR